MPWDDLIKIFNKAEVRVKIQGSINLDQQYLKEKQLLKMNINFWDNQAKKSKITVLLTKTDPSKSD